MLAAALTEKSRGRVELIELPDPEPGPGQVALRVTACGVCRTDLHVVDGDLPYPELPIVPGHEIVGVVEHVGDGVTAFGPGDRVGVPWLGSSCGTCWFCRHRSENLCREAIYTGYHIHGGYAERTVADVRYTFKLPAGLDDIRSAPLLCAGLIGHRAHGMAGDGKRLGLYGFGAAAHILAQVAVWQGKSVFAFTRPGDASAQRLARELGCTWAGASDVLPPEPLDAAIIFAPLGALVPHALRSVRPAGTVVCAGIHMSDIPSFPYHLLWEERILRTVANLTRRDGEEFLALAPQVPVRCQVRTYPLRDANAALADLREGRVVGAAVLVP